MNKLLYNEIIKHINNSIISVSTYLNNTPITLRAHNPVSNLTIYFSKNTYPTVSYQVKLSIDSYPFTAAESKQLFRYAERRYNDHFKNAAEEKISLYKRMLISNNMTRSK